MKNTTPAPTSAPAPPPAPAPVSQPKPGAGLATTNLTDPGEDPPAGEG